MSAIRKIAIQLVECPACSGAGGGCAHCGAADCDSYTHEGWTGCRLCGGEGEVDATVAVVHARRASLVAAPALVTAVDDDIRF